MGTQMMQQQICEECRGSGRVWRSVPRPDDPEYEEEETCRTCGGSGYVDVSEPEVRL
jgi:DnaJ-class molecular chaperone